MKTAPSRKNPLLRILTVSFVALAAFGLYVQVAQAAPLTSVNDLISDSRPSNDVNHTIQMVTPTGVAISETIILKFDDAGDAFDLTSIAFGDLDIAEDTDGSPGTCSGTLTDETLAATATASDWGVAVNTGTDEITLTAPSAGTPIAAGACLIIEIGTHATSGTNQINNAATQGSYIIDIAGSMTDSGAALVAVVDEITASVTVDETLSFTVAAVAAATCDFNTAPGDITTTATTIPFGTTTGDVFVDGCHDLEISTNAGDGYSVTVAESDVLTSGGNTIADGSCDGSCTETTFAAWATASGNNGFGYCLTDEVGAPSGVAGVNQCSGASLQFKIFPSLTASETPEQIMSETTAVAADSVIVGYRLSVAASQTAGTYTNSVVYVATPTY